MNEIWNKTDETAACFRHITPVSDGYMVENELAGVFNVFKSKNSSWKQMEAFLGKRKTNKIISKVRQTLPVSK